MKIVENFPVTQYPLENKMSLLWMKLYWALMKLLLISCMLTERFQASFQECIQQLEKGRNHTLLWNAGPHKESTSKGK